MSDNEIESQQRAIHKPSQATGFTTGGSGALPKHPPIAPIARTKMTTTRVATSLTAILIVAASEKRNYLLIQNTGTVDIMLGFGSTPNVTGDNAVILTVGTQIDFSAGIVPNNEIYAVSVGQSFANIIDGTRQ